MEASSLPKWHNSVGINQNKLTFKSQDKFPSLKRTIIEGWLTSAIFSGRLPNGI